MDEWYDKIKPELEQEIERKQKILEAERQRFSAVKSQKKQEYRDIERAADKEQRKAE